MNDHKPKFKVGTLPNDVIATTFLIVRIEEEGSYTSTREFVYHTLEDDKIESGAIK